MLNFRTLASSAGNGNLVTNDDGFLEAVQKQYRTNGNTRTRISKDSGRSNTPQHQMRKTKEKIQGGKGKG